MIHIYRLHGYAPARDWLRWSCATCGRVVDHEVPTGALVVRAVGQDVPHAGHVRRYYVWDDATGDVAIDGPWERALSDVRF